MTAKEALEYFKRRKEQIGLSDRIQQAENLAIKALEKRMPKKPVTEKDKVIFGIVCGRCPECDSDVYSTTNLYCHNCGQALDWSETE